MTSLANALWIKFSGYFPILRRKTRAFSNHQDSLRNGVSFQVSVKITYNYVFYCIFSYVRSKSITEAAKITLSNLCNSISTRRRRQTTCKKLYIDQGNKFCHPKSTFISWYLLLMFKYVSWMFFLLTGLQKISFPRNDLKNLSACGTISSWDYSMNPRPPSPVKPII